MTSPSASRVRLAILPALALAAALTGCSSVELRYTQAEAPVPLEKGRMMQIASIAYKDVSGGIRGEGAGITLKRPFFDTFKDAAVARLEKLGVKLNPRIGAAVEIQLTQIELKRAKQGLATDLTATVGYSVFVRGGVDTICRQDSSSWATVREGALPNPAAAVLERAMSKAVDRLGATVAESCLYMPETVAAQQAAAAPLFAARDPKMLAIVIGVDRYRDGAAALAAENDAKAVAEAAKTLLGSPKDRTVLLVGDHATYADLQKTLERWLPAHAGTDDTVFVYFAGAGAATAATGTAYLLPYDGDLAALEETAFPLQRLYNDLGHLPGSATVVLDACFSGTGGRSALATDAAPLTTADSARVPKGVTVIHAASPGQGCGADKTGGVFTRFFLQAMKEKRSDFQGDYELSKPKVVAYSKHELGQPQEPRWKQGL